MISTLTTASLTMDNDLDIQSLYYIGFNMMGELKVPDAQKH